MPKPSIKTQADIRFYWQKIEQNMFDQDDFRNLIITLRDFAPKNSRLMEIGDFVAHPTRMKGTTHDHLKLMNISQNAAGIVFRIPVGFDVEEVLTSLADTLIAVDAAPSVAVRKTVKERAAELSLCSLGMLHHAVVKISGKEAILKIVGLLKQMRSIQTTLELRAVLHGGASLSLIATKLQSTQWCDFNITEIEKTERVRAIRAVDGLKLRKF